MAFRTDQGSTIKNWPSQTIQNGVDRNNSTGWRYKRAIRILKRIRDRMKGDGDETNGNLPSFLIECLVWNANLDAFQKDSYHAMMRHIIANLRNRTRNDKDCNEWGEVNELKYLFRTSQPWTRQQANDYLQAVWNYIGYE